MILTCPSCGTQYVVKDGAIPPGGRQVRCAACKHSWHEDPEVTSESESRPVEESPAESPPSSDAEEESFAEATLIEPRSGPEAEERAYEETAIGADEALAPEAPVAETEDAADLLPVSTEHDAASAAPPSHGVEDDWQEPPQPEAQEDEFTPFPAGDEVEPRRRSSVRPILLVIIAVIVIAAAFWFLAPPELKARLGLAGLSTSPLALVTTHMDRQRLESGNELLTVTGRVINPTAKEQSVPPLQAQLKTRAGKIVYSWTIAPPARSLPPGASASFNSAEVNVPPGGDELTITLGTQAG